MMKEHKLIPGILFQTKDIKRASFVWNLLAATMNSFQTMVLLLVLTHMGTSTDSSIFVMAYTIGNLLCNIGRFGIRQYQVTDAKQKYKFADYLRLRYISITMMAVATVIYLIYGIIFKNYLFEKSVVVFLICIYKGIEAFEDVFHGRMQQKGRLDVASKILFTRLIVFVLGYILVFVITKNILLTTLINVIITSILFIVLNHAVWKFFTDDNKATDKGNMRLLFQSGLPLCLSSILNMYLDNSPKYIIDGVVNDDVQTAFNIIFMPVFVVSLLSTFIYQPHLKKVGELWADQEIDSFVKLMVRLFAVPIALDILIVIVGSLIGLPILEFIYSVPLKEYKLIFISFLFAGGMTAIKNLFVVLLTTVRKQSMLFVGHAVSSVVLFLFGKTVYHIWMLNGLAVFFVIILLATNVFFTIISIIEIERHKRMVSGNIEQMNE